MFNLYDVFVGAFVVFKNFNMEDASQVFVGAFALAVPISFSEEAWRLAETLPWLNLILLFCLSMMFLGLFAFQSVFQQNISKRISTFLFRIIFAYLISALVVALILVCIDKLPLIDSPMLALKRVIVISMPASMGAIIVDSFDKE